MEKNNRISKSNSHSQLHVTPIFAQCEYTQWCENNFIVMLGDLHTKNHFGSV